LAKDLYRGINKCKKVYQPRTNLIKYEKDLLAGFYNILDRWKNCQNIYEINNVRHTKRHTAEPFISEPSPFEV
jgi:hypothetical protein